MGFDKIRCELRDYYGKKVDAISEKIYETCWKKLDAVYYDGMSPYEMKSAQYKLIPEEIKPHIFPGIPFYFETGAIRSLGDGAPRCCGKFQAGGWTYFKNEDMFLDADRELWKKRVAHTDELLYLLCGPYNDTKQHFNFNYRPIMAKGLKGIYDEAKAKLPQAKTDEEKEFLRTVCDGMKSLARISERFSECAEELLCGTDDNSEKENLRRIADTAKRVPWNAPETFCEALGSYLFLRQAVGAVEGIGINTFGRLDTDLYPFYKKDIENGTLDEKTAYELIAKFLLVSDMHYDHDMKMVGYADHELENSYVLGGCDGDGKPLYNELTEMFLRAIRNESIIFPKPMCRYSSDSPKEYLDSINKTLMEGKNVFMYQNDDAMIPALVRAGRTLSEARDYIVTGCWGVWCQEVEKYDDGTYVNLIKPFEFSLHKRYDKMQKVGIEFLPMDGAKNFEELYSVVCENLMRLFRERIQLTRRGGNMWNKVCPLPIFSSTMKNCLDTCTDYTAGGAKYRDDQFSFIGFPNMVDSLIAIKELCFDSGKYKLSELFDAVRHDWEGYEDMRTEALACHGWGDGSEEACRIAARFNRDLYGMAGSLEGTYGGKVHICHLTYTEIRWWGEKTLATPDGRKSGEYLSQGLTPSRLKKIPSATAVIESLSRIDPTEIAGNSVVNIILQTDRLTPELCEAFVRATCRSAVQSFQLNCTTKETLLDAQKHPENYRDLIVRVCGFSARFTSLSPEWQKEVITRSYF